MGRKCGCVLGVRREGSDHPSENDYPTLTACTVCAVALSTPTPCLTSQLRRAQTSTSHLLLYGLAPTSSPAYDTPATSLFPPGGGPGEGDTLMGWTLKPTGIAFVMGGCTSILAQPHSLLLTLRHPPSILAVPYPLPPQLLSPPGSHFPPIPLDGDGEDQVECDIWDLTKGQHWLSYGGGELSCRKTS